MSDPASTDRPQRKSATRDDVARLAGISPAVVSYVVNNGPRPVSDATRSRVQLAIEQLGYRPNGLARSLGANSSFVIGLGVPDSGNLLFGDTSRAIENAAYQDGSPVLLGNTDGDEKRERRYVGVLLEQRADGIILISAGHSNVEIRHVSDAGVPLVLVDRLVRGFGASIILVDNEDGGFQATRHLLDHGHSRIACIAGPSDLSPASDRRRGWTRAMREARIGPDDDLLVRSDFTRLGGYISTKRLLSSESPPTAIFASTDQQGIGALRAARELGRRVPSDLAVVAFDGIAESVYTNPGLSTIHQPTRQVGDQAVRSLLAMIRGEPPSTDIKVFPVELTPNGSCGCTERLPPSDY